VHTAQDLTVSATLRLNVISFDKLKTNKKSMTEFCGDSVQTCNSAETRRRNQTNAELMLCTICTSKSLLLEITHRYKQTIIFNKKLYVIHDIYCRKRYLIFQDFLGEGLLSNPLANLTKITLTLKSRKLLSINEENYSYRSTGVNRSVGSLFLISQ